VKARTEEKINKILETRAEQIRQEIEIETRVKGDVIITFELKNEDKSLTRTALYS